MVLFMVNYLDYMKKIQENNYIEWDVKTITAGDYTIEFDIPPSFFEDFLVKEYTTWLGTEQQHGIEYVSRVDAFRGWIENEMEVRLSQLPDLGYEAEPCDRVKIAITSFAFANSKIISLLEERGNIIKNE